MQKFKIYLISCLAPVFLLINLAAHASSSIANAKNSLAPILTKATPAVVNIAVEKVIKAKNDDDSLLLPQRPETKVLGVGSGVIVDAKKGLIVTNAHVVKNQKVMLVTLKDGRRYHAKLIGQSAKFDIAVIKINAKHLTAMQYGDSDQANAGDFVIAIGSPFGLQQTVTSGVISALHRVTPLTDGFQDFIQTDAPINPGNSGGALINMSGQLIGMNTAMLSSGKEGNIGIGFAIPSNMVKNVANQIIKYGKVVPGLMGVLAQNISPELMDAMHLKSDHGVIVTKVVPDSPAEKAGIQVKDIITQVNNKPIRSNAQLHDMMGVLRPGTKVNVTVLRDHKIKKLSATLANAKALMKQRQLKFVGGMRLKDYMDLEPDGTVLKGLLVLSVDDNSQAALAGLIPGDIIIDANNQPVTGIDQLMQVLTKNPKHLLVKIARGGGMINLFLVIQPND